MVYTIHIPNSTEGDVDSAVEAAKKAFVNGGVALKGSFQLVDELADTIDDCLRN